MERTLIILKPDTVQRGLIGKVVSRFEDKGLQIAGMKLMVIPKQTAETHYAPHKDRPFYPGLVRFMTSGPVVVLVLQGVGAIAIARNLMGATFGGKAAPGTIRGDFGVSNAYNLVHGSDSPEAAEKELGLFFKKEELIDWKPAVQEWIYDSTSGKPE